MLTVCGVDGEVLGEVDVTPAVEPIVSQVVEQVAAAMPDDGGTGDADALAVDVVTCSLAVVVALHMVVGAVASLTLMRSLEVR